MTAGSSGLLRWLQAPNCSARVRDCFIVRLPGVPCMGPLALQASSSSTGQPWCSWEVYPPARHQQPACKPIWLEGKQRHPPTIPPVPTVLGTDRASQFGVAKLRFFQGLFQKQSRQLVPQAQPGPRACCHNGWHSAGNRLSHHTVLPSQPHTHVCCRPQA